MTTAHIIIIYSLKRHCARDVQVQVITVFKNWTCFKHIWATALTRNCWTRTSAPGAWAPRPPSAPVTAMMLAPFGLGKSNCGIETKLIEIPKKKLRLITRYIIILMWEVILRTVEFASEVQSFKVENDKNRKSNNTSACCHTLPSHCPRRVPWVACNLKILFTWSWVLGLHPSSPEPAILSDQRQHRQQSCFL